MGTFVNEHPDPQSSLKSSTSPGDNRVSMCRDGYLQSHHCGQIWARLPEEKPSVELLPWQLTRDSKKREEEQKEMARESENQTMYNQYLL